MPHDDLHFGPFRLHVAQRLLTEKGKPIALGSRALEILILLIERAGQLVSKDDIVARVWPQTYVGEANLRVHIAALRRALGDGRAGRRFLTNTPGRGYTFVAPITSGADVARRQAAEKAAPLFGLPMTSPRILGRGDVIEVLQAQLQQKRLVTVAGIGGIGKTTVAVAVAEASLAAYPDGVRFVDLAPVMDAGHVAGAVASAFEIALRAAASGADLVAHVRDRKLLLVLDGCEHVLTAVADIVEALYAGAPGVHMLVTSREPLRARAENVYRLQPLLIPPPGVGLTAAEALTYPAVQLFVDRASESSDGFELTDADAPVVTNICRRLDGIALAIELAAGRVAALGLRTLLSQLDNRFAVLTRGRRTALPRHQTLAATLDWSYGLLTEPERLVLRRLSIFAGGFTPDLAAAIAKGDGVPAAEILEFVADLVAKSLIAADTGGDVVRYKLLETTRAYAFQKLADSGERETYMVRFAQLLCSLFESAEDDLETLPGRLWVAKYALYLDDVRTALDWAFSPGGNLRLGWQLTVAAAPLWQQLSLLEEFCGRAERALTHLQNGTSGDARTDMKLYGVMASALPARGPGKAETEAAYTKALALAEAVGDVDYQLRALRGLWAGHLNNDNMGPTGTTALAYKFAEVARRSANPADALIAERMIGFTLHLQGQHAEARKHIETMLASYTAAKGNIHIIRYQYDQRVAAYTTLAIISWLEGAQGQALHEAERAVSHAVAVGHPESLCYALAQAACPIALLNGDDIATARFSHMLVDHAGRSAQHTWRRWGDCFNGMRLLQKGDEGGAAIFQEAFAGLPVQGPRTSYSVSITQLAEGLAMVGRGDESLRLITKALTDNAGEVRWNTSELLRLKGEALLRSAPAAAEDCFLQALGLAQQHGAKSWELRSLVSLAKLWAVSGRAEDAAARLQALMAGLDGAGRTRDVMEAYALLKRLRTQAGRATAKPLLN
ncbi:MAG: winged helix-turn-helix domain-containing protein [Rhodospirillaceae bacterium]|nr:winged helix-turn-helix domain-containing protein [Rhodospirillaceae bacterium]